MIRCQCEVDVFWAMVVLLEKLGRPSTNRVLELSFCHIPAQVILSLCITHNQRMPGITHYSIHTRGISRKKMKLNFV